MVTQQHVTRTHGQFLANGSTPTKMGLGPLVTLTTSGATSYSLLRMRTDIELYVPAGGGSAGADLSFADEVLMVAGAISYIGGTGTDAETPLTNENLTPEVPGGDRVGGWGQWEYLYPDVQFANVITPQRILVTWRPRGGTVDTQYRRRLDDVRGIDVFLPWELQDGSGLINTTDASGNSYNLGARFAATLWWESRS